LPKAAYKKTIIWTKKLGKGKQDGRRHVLKGGYDFENKRPQ
jgi:hypothetical protein